MLIHVSRVRSHLASRVTWHSHQGFELLFLLEGATAYEFAKQGAVELRGGHFLVVPPGLVHRGLYNVRSPSTICGLALKASRPSSWKNTTFTALDLVNLRKALEEASLKAHPFNPALRWLVRRLIGRNGRLPGQSPPRRGRNRAAGLNLCGAGRGHAPDAGPADRAQGICCRGHCFSSDGIWRSR